MPGHIRKCPGTVLLLDQTFLFQEHAAGQRRLQSRKAVRANMGPLVNHQIVAVASGICTWDGEIVLVGDITRFTTRPTRDRIPPAHYSHEAGGGPLHLALRLDFLTRLNRGKRYVNLRRVRSTRGRRLMPVFSPYGDDTMPGSTER